MGLCNRIPISEQNEVFGCADIVTGLVVLWRLYSLVVEKTYGYASVAVPFREIYKQHTDLGRPGANLTDFITAIHQERYQYSMAIRPEVKNAETQWFLIPLEENRLWSKRKDLFGGPDTYEPKQLRERFKAYGAPPDGLGYPMFGMALLWLENPGWSQRNIGYLEWTCGLMSV